MVNSRSSAYTLYWNKIRKSDLPRLGLKCFKLAQHKQGGVPIPPFFAIPNNRVAEIINSGAIAPRLEGAVAQRLIELQAETGKEFGLRGDPLLVSARSGDPRSMHGQLLSLMNIGLNDATYAGLVKKYGPESRTEALWLYLNLIVDYARQVNNIDRQTILPLLQRMRDKDAGPEALEAMIDEAQNLSRHYPVEFTFPQDVREQLTQAIKAVANSWTSVTAKCAAASLDLGPKEYPSIFVQEMVFSMLTADSAFVSFLTHPGMQGTFAPQISGRRVMSGTAINQTIRLDELGEIERYRNPSRQIVEISDRLVRIEKYPLNIEMVFDRGIPSVLQVSRADLSPIYHVRAINELVQSGVLTEEEAIAERAEVIIKKQIKLHKLNPAAEYEVVAEAKGGGSGAMAGLLALSPAQALELCQHKKRVILLSTEPQDENVYMLTYGHKIDAIVATYGVGRGSHIADLAMANGIPLILGMKDIEFPPEVTDFNDPGAVLIQGRSFRAGEIVVVDGQKGKLMITSHPEPVIEDRQIESHVFGINYLELMHSIEVRFGGCSYQQILEEHAREFNNLRGLDPNTGDRAQINGLQSRIHCLHRLARKIGINQGKNRLEVDLDVAVADGNLDRVPGLEDLNFLIKQEDGKYVIITGAEDDNEAYDMTGGPIIMGLTEVGPVIQSAHSKGLILQYYRRSIKPTQHTQEITEYGVSFPLEQLDEVVNFLKDHFRNR